MHTRANETPPLVSAICLAVFGFWVIERDSSVYVVVDVVVVFVVVRLVYIVFPKAYHHQQWIRSIESMPSLPPCVYG